MKRLFFIFFILFYGFAFSQTDSTSTKTLEEVSVYAKRDDYIFERIIIPSIVVSDSFILNNYNGNLFKTLDKLSGINSIDIGSGFSKPTIRGLGFSRIILVENGIKHQGQQWGADHGLEIDAFRVENISIIKGSSSLLYGSDAIGGVIQLIDRPSPIDNMLFGEFMLLGNSINNRIGESLLFALKKDKWFSKLRYTRHNYSDYKIPTKSINYLTQSIPIFNNRLKNTAGVEKDFDFSTEYRSIDWVSKLSISNAYQKLGTFPGAHGIPDINRVIDDGNYWGIDLPYSVVNHFKASLSNTFNIGNSTLEWNIGYQKNFREEYSPFNTHYLGLIPPKNNPDKEISFNLNSLASNIKVNYYHNNKWTHTYGIDASFKNNGIDGYSFLLPKYDEFSLGAFYLSNWIISNKINVSFGIRYDYGLISIHSFFDNYLNNYLQMLSYSDEIVDKYSYRTRSVNRVFGNYSYSIGFDYNHNESNNFKFTLGKSFRLPGANELASNGIHHATFRHEMGNPSLQSENGWQLDVLYSYNNKYLSFVISPFFNYFSNYIFLQPSGSWSILPDAGQIYEYKGSKAIIYGSEFDVSFFLSKGFILKFSSDYILTYNLRDKLPLSFSPPASFLINVSKNVNNLNFYFEYQQIFTQNRVARNEDKTKGASLFNYGVNYSFKLFNLQIETFLSINNILNTKYYNHMSFYRKVEIPEPGTNIQLLIKIPFKIYIL